jgi:NAD+ synthase
LYKGQVRELAKHLGVPKAIYEKSSSPQLRPGHEATQEIPMPYEKLDHALEMLFVEKKPMTYVAKTLCVPHEIVQKVMEMNRRSEHKRKYPAMVVKW